MHRASYICLVVYVLIAYFVSIAQCDGTETQYPILYPRSGIQKVAVRGIKQNVDETTTPAPDTTTVAPVTTTTAPVTTTTLAPDTTPAPDTTTPAPDTTTPAPDTTTVAPTTPAPETTTVSPTTTTTAPVTTTTTSPETTTASPTTTTSAPTTTTPAPTSPSTTTTASPGSPTTTTTTPSTTTSAPSIAPVPTTTTAAPGTPTTKTPTTTSTPGTPTTTLAPGTPTTTPAPGTPTTVSPVTTRSPTSTTTTASPTVTSSPAGDGRNATTNIDTSSILTYAKIWAPIVGAVGLSLLLLTILFIVVAVRLYRIKQARLRLSRGLIDPSAGETLLPLDQYSPINAMSPTGSLDQTILADLVKKISVAYEENRFIDVTNHCIEMYNVVQSRGFGVPNPSNIFMGLITVMEQSSFQQAQVHHQLELVCVLHCITALTLLEKSNRGTRLDEQLKIRLSTLMTNMKRINGLMNDDDVVEMERHVDYADLHFYLDCISQCIFLMQDTALNQDKLIQALSNVTSPGGIAQMVLYETKITPRMWYKPILSCTLLSHVIRSDRDSLMYFMQRNVKTNENQKVNWRLWYHHVVTLGDVICDGRINQEMCELALDANHDTLTDLFTLCHYRSSDKKQSAVVRSRAVYELGRIVKSCRHDSIRQHAIQMVLDMRIKESNKLVQESIRIVMIEMSHEMVNWKDQIKTGTDKLAQELDTEWENLQEMRNEITELEHSREDMLRSIALKELESNEMVHRVEIKKSSVEYCKQKQAFDLVDQQLKQVIKQQSYESDNVKQRVLVQRRMELEDTLENMPKEQLARMDRMEQTAEDMLTQIRELQGKVEDVSEKMLAHQEFYKTKQEAFNRKRDNFEHVQKDYRLATLLGVQQLENKTKKVRGSVIIPISDEDEIIVTPMLGRDDQEEQDEVPEAFVCPITCQIMQEPVFVVESGHSYEKAAIEKWLSRNATDPLTGVKLSNKTLVANHSLRRMITEHSKSKIETV